MVNSDKYPSIKNVFKKNSTIGGRGEFSLPEFEYLQSCKWIFTEKIDGVSIRVILDDKVEFRGRSDATYLLEPLSEHLYQLFGNEDILSEYAEYGAGLCLYGEYVGGNIWQGNKYRPSLRFILFDAMTEYGWASRRDVVDIAEDLCIPAAPVVFEGTLVDAIKLVYTGFRSSYGSFFVEGLVGRPEPELLNRYGDRIICKIKHREFRSRRLTCS
jgi:hypothetical protein